MFSVLAHLNICACLRLRNKVRDIAFNKACNRERNKARIKIGKKAPINSENDASIAGNGLGTISVQQNKGNKRFLSDILDNSLETSTRPKRFKDVLSVQNADRTNNADHKV